MATKRQLNFGAGEIAPAIARRVDQPPFYAGLRTLRNGYPLKTGGAQNRGGFRHKLPSCDNSNVNRIIPFNQNKVDSHLLEIGDHYIRPMKNGTHLTNNFMVVSFITDANPAVATLICPNGHGMVYENDTATTMTLTTGSNYNVGTTGLTLTASAAFFDARYIGGGHRIILKNANGTAEAHLEITARASDTSVTVTVKATYDSRTGVSNAAVASDLQNTATASWWRINFSSVGVDTHLTFSGVDGMTEVNGNTYAVKSIGVFPVILQGIGCEIQVTLKTLAGADLDASGFTTFSSSNGYGIATRQTTPTAITAADPPVVTLAGHGLEDGQQVYISGVGGMTQLNGRYFLVNNSDEDTFELTDLNGTDIDASGFTAFTSAGTVDRVLILRMNNQWIDTTRGYVGPGFGWAIDDVDEVTYTQRSPYKMVLAHQDYVTHEVLTQSEYGAGIFTTDFGYDFFMLRAWVQQPDTPATHGEGVGAPTIGYSSGGDSLPGQRVSYRATAISKNGEESYYGSVFRDDTATPIPEDVSSSIVLSISFTTKGETPVGYNFYRSVNGAHFGFIGRALYGLTAWRDTGVEANYNISTPENWVDTTHLNGDKDCLGAVGYFHRRLFLGGSKASPDVGYGSSINAPYNFLSTTPIVDSSPIAFKLAGDVSARIRHFSSAARFFIFTDSDGFVVEGIDDGNRLTPDGFNPVRISEVGAGLARPVLAKGLMCFVESDNRTIYGIPVANPAAGPIDLIADWIHLFNGYTISDLAYQSSPNSILWAVRSDGKLLSKTLLPENEIMGWARHDTDGLVKSIAVVHEAGESVLYAIIQRTINGATVNNIERLIEREGLTSAADGSLLDAHVYYNSTATTTVTGLWHLEGENVAVIADGVVLHNPYNSTLGTKTVANGQITIASSASKICVGLPYLFDFETLRIDSSQSPLAHRKKLVGKVNVDVEYTRGLYAGNSLPSDASPLTDLKPVGVVGSNGTTDLANEEVFEVVIPPEWNKDGRIVLRQIDPLPVTILSVLPEGHLNAGG